MGHRNVPGRARARLEYRTILWSPRGTTLFMSYSRITVATLPSSKTSGEDCSEKNGFKVETSSSRYA